MVTRLDTGRLKLEGRAASLEQAIAEQARQLAELEVRGVGGGGRAHMPFVSATVALNPPPAVGKTTKQQAMANDAQAAREKARTELSAFEAQAQAVRKAQDAERTRLCVAASSVPEPRAADRAAGRGHRYQLTEERRRQQEALERRQRLKSGALQTAADDDEDLSEDAQWTVSTCVGDDVWNHGGCDVSVGWAARPHCQGGGRRYEAALRRIQTVTGVVELDDVVTRFASQDATQAELSKLQAQSTATLNELRQAHARVSKQHESLKYTGQARNASNERILKEFEVGRRRPGPLPSLVPITLNFFSARLGACAATPAGGGGGAGGKAGRSVAARQEACRRQDGH